MTTTPLKEAVVRAACLYVKALERGEKSQGIGTAVGISQAETRLRDAVTAYKEKVKR